MGILYSEVKYYKSSSISFLDPSLNGGSEGDEIINDTLHSIFPEISATERENGTTKTSKLFVKNESVDRVMQDCIFYIKQDVQPDDRLGLFEASTLEPISFHSVSDISGSTTPLAAGSSVEIESIVPSGKTTDDLVGRTFSIGQNYLSVATAVDATHVTFNEDIVFDILSTDTISSSDANNIFESDEDFSTKKRFVNSVVKTTVIEGLTTIDIPIVDKPFFEIGDNIVIVDEYFRATYRGEIIDVQDSASDTNNAVITLSAPYASTRTIPALAGYICNGVKKTLLPSDSFGMWAQLTVAPTNAIDSEIINQFQIGVHFDDVALS